MPSNLRRVVGHAVSCALVLALTACAAPGPGQRQGELSRRLILFDVHNHMTPGLKPQTIAAEMDRAGVGRIVLMANKGARWSDMEPVGRALGDRVVLYVPVVGWGWNTRNPAYLDRVADLLRSGAARGLGEFMVLHYPIAPGGRTPGNETSAYKIGGDPGEAPYVINPIDAPVMRQMLAVASAAGVPAHFHMETTPESIASLERALAAFPQLTFIWAHQDPVKLTGGRFAEHARRGDPALVRRLMERYPNLQADIAVGYETLFFDADRDHDLPLAWRALYEDHAGRFMIGLDLATRRFFENGFQRRAEQMRAWLGQLSPQTAERIGCSNAHRVILKTPMTVVAATQATAAAGAGGATVSGRITPAVGNVRIDRTLDGPGGRRRALLATDPDGTFRDPVADLPPGAYRATYRALCDGLQPGSQPVVVTVTVAG